MDLKSTRNFGASAKAKLPLGAGCAFWSMLLPDAADGLLNDTEQRALEQHLAGCTACTEELAEAQRGLAWLSVLKDHAPEPPSGLLNNILAQTTGFAEAGVSLPPLAHLPDVAWQPALPVPNHGPAWQSSGGWRSWLGLGDAGWEALLQPRLAMTGAMAFFSICVTLNLLGISVDQLNAQTLRSGSLHRSMADTGATVVRSLQGLRVVYRVESRVSELRAQMDDRETNHTPEIPVH